MTISLLKTTFLCLILGLINQKAIGQVGLRQQNDTFIVIEKRAEYPDGMKAMYEFISKNLKFPMSVATIEGTVYLGFCIEADGRLTDIEVRKGLRKDYDEEAVRVVSIMPKWIPAVEFGTKKTVKSYFTVPIHFRLE